MTCIRLSQLLLAAVLFAGATAAETLNAPQWHFRAVFPCKSQVGGQSVDTDLGKLVITTFACEDKGHAYFVALNDFPKDTVTPERVDNMYAGAVNSAAEGTKGAVRSIETFTLANITGREAFIDSPVGVFRSRLFIVGDRLYQAMALVPAGAEKSDDVTKFLDSFTLIDIAALLPPAK